MSSPTSGPRTPPTMTPVDGSTPNAGLTNSAQLTAIAAPANAATSSRRPVMSPAASPIIAAGKMMSMPRTPGSAIDPPAYTPARVARFHGMNVDAIAPIQ